MINVYAAAKAAYTHRMHFKQKKLNIRLCELKLRLLTVSC